jgi:hypothetical protein
MIRPALSKLAEGTKLTVNLINDIINRTEYAADLLRQYKLVAGDEMYVEPHYDGTRISYLQSVAGGATPTRPLAGDFPLAGFLGIGKFRYLVFSDLDACPSGPNPPPDGVATFEGTATENFIKCIAVIGANISLNYSVGSLYNLQNLIAGFPVIKSNTRRCVNPNLGCSNPTGELVRIDLSNSL